MSVILEALQRTTSEEGKPGPITSRVVDVQPTPGVKIHKSPFRILWLMMSFSILLFVGAAGAAAFYWVLEHRDQFSFGFNPRRPQVAAPTQVAPAPAQASGAAAADAQAAELPPPMPLEVVKRPAATPSLAYLPPPPVIGGAPSPQGAPAATQSQPANIASAPANMAKPSAAPSAATAAPAGAAATPASPFSLGTILCGDAHDCSAMINGHTVHRGEMIKDYRVIEITTTQVRLQRGSEEPIVLSLFR